VQSIIGNLIIRGLIYKMKFAIAYYKDNIAGKNIVEEFKKISTLNPPILKLEKETIYSNDISKEKYPELEDIDFLVFASTHRSEKGEPSLCIHATGNWKKAELGGQPEQICPTSSFVLKYLFKELNSNARNLTNYNITLEVTHHGPSINLPCCFIEIGSQEKQWKDTKACKIIAKTIASLNNYQSNKNWIPALGIGGPHYAPIFNQIQLNSEYAIGHIIPQYSLPITTKMLHEAKSKTIEELKEVLIDWKGCGNSESRSQIINLLKESSLNYKRTSEVEKLNQSNVNLFKL